MNIHNRVCITIMYLLPYTICADFYSREFLHQKHDNPAMNNQVLNEEDKKSFDMFSSLPKEVQQKVMRMDERIKNNPEDTREWYQKKRYWALIGASTLCGGVGGGYGAAKLVAFLNVSQTAATVVVVAGSTTTGVATGVGAFYVVSECKGYEIRFVENGVYIVKKGQNNHDAGC